MAFTSSLRSDASAHPSGSGRVMDLPARPHLSGVSWAAVVAGGAGAAALSLILLLLGTGLGLSAVSPWVRDGLEPQSLGVSAIVWITFTQLLAAALGGYLAGRLRGQWLDVQSDEIYFRDSAHGFLAWAIATLASAALLSAAIASIVGGGVQAGVSLAKAGGDLVPISYVMDSLFRPAAPPTLAATANPVTYTAERAAVITEVTGIFMNSLRSGALPPEDLRYVGQLVAQRTGLGEAEASQRVRDGYARAQTTLRNAEASAREAADKARKASAYVALWLFIALLSSAFVASLAGIFGGRQRDL